MGVSQNDSCRMEGWLYLIRSNRFGLQYSRKRYFVLHDLLFKSYKSNPVTNIEDPVRSAVIDSCIRVTDNGRESIQRKADMNKRTAVDRPRRDSQSLRLNCSNKSHHLNSIDWTFCSSSVADATTSDVVAPSSWTIFGCQNGLRLFKEAKDRESHGKWNDHPAIMAVGVVDGTSEAIFQTLMSLGPSRSEWDFCHYKGSVIEHLDGHTDIVHKLLRRDWLPWSMRKRDLLLQRYWRREDDGTYVILYHSVFHQKCPCQKGYVRACLKTLRELFIAKLGDCSSSYFLEEHVRDKRLQQIEEVKVEIQTIVENGKNMADMEEEVAKSPSEHASLMGLNDASDEFFDVSEPLDYDQSENGWPSDFGPEMYSQDTRHARLSSAAGFVKKLHDLAVHKRGYVDLHEKAKEDALLCHYGSTLPKDPTFNLPCSWAQTDPSTFLIRGETYLEDRKKIKAKGTLMQMVAADWLKSDKREDDLGGRPGSIVQKYAAKGGPEFFFIVNIQVPGSTTYTLALYYMMDTPIENAPLLESFVKGDDAFRNSRFKLIPYISKGPWIVKQSVGKKACLVGPALEINYFRGKNYLELDINVGSSTVARGVVSLVVGYLNNLVIEMAFLIQANTPEELPEYLLATCRLNHLDISKAVQVKP
uniref:Pleckstrin homology (PH) domain-containing protein / lipid-binding START domain-containing protein n=1 Tax=Solanum tuberosum TaxID=4113 RepID=M1C950_SOLTU